MNGQLCPPGCCQNSRWFKPTVIIIGILIVIGLFGNICLLLKSPKSPITQITPTPTKGIEGRFCGGIAANLPENQCPTGYDCQLDGNYPDAGGICVKR